MLKINLFTSSQNQYNVNFGTNSRRTNIKLGKDCYSVATCDYFFRNEESTPQDVGNFLINKAKNAKNTEMKIAGSSDMSKFLARTIAMQKSVGVKKYQELFADIELIDIDCKTLKRAKLGIIPTAKGDFDDIRKYLGVNPSDFFTPLKNSDKYYLKGDSSYEKADLTHCKVNENLLDGVKFKNADIRKEILNLSELKSDTLRILEFSNGWHFLPPKDQIDLAFNMSKKTKLNDIIIVGHCELTAGIKEVLEYAGFQADLNLKEVFTKTKNFSIQHLKDLQDCYRECTYLIR